MGDKSKIEWTDATWNPIRGCSRVSEGCRNCYAERVAARFSGKGQPYEGLVGFYFTEPRWNGKVRFIEDKLNEPLHWKKPRRVFVNSMSDLFHEAIPAQRIYQIFMVMWAAHWHTFQVLTKRPQRMKEIVTAWLNVDKALMCKFAPDALPGGEGIPRNNEPLANVWFGVSVEDQKTADERIPLLMRTPAAVRWISYEPALGPLQLTRAHDHCPTHDFEGGFCTGTCRDKRRLDWIVCGGESGPNARPMHPEWALSALRQCQDARVPFFFKQWGEWRAQAGYSKTQLDRGIGFQRVGKKRAGRLLDGREWNEYPEVKR